MRAALIPVSVVLFLILTSTRPLRADFRSPEEDARAVARWGKILRESRDAMERRNAAKELGKLGRKASDAVPALIHALTDEDEGVQILAILALAEIGPGAKAAVPDLIKCLKPAGGESVLSLFRPRVAAEALGRIGEPAVEDLITVLRDSKSVGVRIHAARALAVIGPKAKAAIPTLEAAFKDENRGVRMNAALALVKAGADVKVPLKYLTDMLLTEKGDRQDQAGHALAEIGALAVPGLVEAIKGKDRSAREAASDALGRIGEPAIPPLRELLLDKEKEARKAAARAFGRMDRKAIKKAIPVMIEAMKRGDEGTLEGLAKSLAHAEEDAVPALITLVKEGQGEVRRMAMYSLGRMHDAAKAAVPALIDLLSDKDTDTRGGAVYLLGRIGLASVAALPALLKLAKDPVPEIRGEVIQVIGTLGPDNKEVLAIVLAALRDVNPAIRRAGVRACDSLGPRAKDAVPDLIKLLDDKRVNDSHSYPNSLVHALGSIGPAAKAATPRLLIALKDPDLEHASFAGIVLLQIGVEEKAATAVLARALDKSLQREHHEIRFRTLGMLERAGPAMKPVVPLLVSIYKDDNDDTSIRRDVGRVLKAIDSEAAKKAGVK